LTNLLAAMPYRGDGTQADRDNHANQMNPNNSRYQGKSGGGGGGGGGECCFPANATVMLADGSVVDMSALKIGDVVLSPCRAGMKSSEVYAFGHRDPDTCTLFCVIDTDTGHQLAMTSEHLIPVEGQGYVPAGSITQGDVVQVFDGKGVSNTCVTSVHLEERTGVFAPFTFEGTLFVDGVAASCYAVLKSHMLCHVAMTPIRFLYRVFPGVVAATHAHQGLRIKGASVYVDLLSVFAPLVRLFKI